MKVSIITLAVVSIAAIACDYKRPEATTREPVGVVTLTQAPLTRAPARTLIFETVLTPRDPSDPVAPPEQTQATQDEKQPPARRSVAEPDTAPTSSATLRAAPLPADSEATSADVSAVDPPAPRRLPGAAEAQGRPADVNPWAGGGSH